MRASGMAVDIAQDEVVPGGLGIFWAAAEALLQDVNGVARPGSQYLHEITFGKTWEAGAQIGRVACAQASKQFVVVHNLLLSGARGCGPNINPLRVTPSTGYDESNSSVITVRCQFKSNRHAHRSEVVICGTAEKHAGDLAGPRHVGCPRHVRGDILRSARNQA